MIIAIVILIALIGGGIFAYMKKLFWFQKSSASAYRKYNTIYSSGKIKGACGPEAGTGVSATAKTSSECASACDATPTTCNGYDWDETNCMLMPSIPTTAIYTKGKKEECRAFSK